jgi:hypothetical protein
MTDTPFQPGSPEFHAIDERSAPPWLATLRHAIFVFALYVMNGMMITLRRPPGGLLAGMNAAISGLALFVAAIVQAVSAIAARAVVRVVAPAGFLISGFFIAGSFIAGWFISGPVIFLGSFVPAIAGLKLSGRNENGSIACSNRPIRKLVAGTGFEPVTFGL